jgi:hypothetical protein
LLNFSHVVVQDLLDKKLPVMQYLREKEGKVYGAPVVMAKKELSPKYMKLVFRQLGFTDEEIDVLL